MSLFNKHNLPAEEIMFDQFGYNWDCSFEIKADDDVKYFVENNLNLVMKELLCQMGLNTKLFLHGW